MYVASSEFLTFDFWLLTYAKCVISIQACTYCVNLCVTFMQNVILYQNFWRFCVNIFDDSVSTFLTILCQHFWQFCVNIFDDSVSTFWTILCQHFWRFYFCREKSRRHRVLWAGNSAGEGVERKTWDNNWKWLIEDDTDFVLDFLRLLPVQSCLNFGGKKLLWVSAYVRNLSGKKNFAWNGTTCAFVNLKENNEFADVTLACEGGQQIEAHKVILAASSSFFQNLGNS